MNEKMLEHIKECAIYGYEETVSNLLKTDLQYQQLAEIENEYEKKYEQVRAALPENVMEIFDHLMSIRDQEATIYDFWVYIAGIDAGIYFNGLLKRA